MADLSYTSSSSALPIPGAAARAGLIALIRRLPAGALIACTLAPLLHLVMAWIVFPEPQCSPQLRHKLLALTKNARPTVVFAGDSRMQSGANPLIVADVLGLSPKDVANIAVEGCAPSNLRAAYRTYAARFAARPVVVMNIAFFSINDSAEVLLEDETLWSVSVPERFHLVSPSRAFATSFMPELTLVRSIVGDGVRLPDTMNTYRGFGTLHESTINHLSPIQLNAKCRIFRDGWFRNPRIDGVTWRSFEQSVDALRRAGVQVVLVDLPLHEVFESWLAKTPEAEALHRFHTKQAAYCADRGIPLLRYTFNEITQGATGPAFRDFCHLTNVGATRLSQKIAADLQRLMQQGRIHVP